MSLPWMTVTNSKSLYQQSVRWNAESHITAMVRQTTISQKISETNDLIGYPASATLSLVASSVCAHRITVQTLQVYNK